MRFQLHPISNQDIFSAGNLPRAIINQAIIIDTRLCWQLFVKILWLSKIFFSHDTVHEKVRWLLSLYLCSPCRGSITTRLSSIYRILKSQGWAAAKQSVHLTCGPAKTTEVYQSFEGTAESDVLWMPRESSIIHIPLAKTFHAWDLWNIFPVI